MKQSIFRSIRRKLLHEGKLVRYITYAIGEVVLIIVGILFALQISDWNEDRKTQSEFDLYVTSLIADVRSAIKSAELEITTYEKSASHGLTILKVLQNSEDTSRPSEDFEDALDDFDKFILPTMDVGSLGGLKSGDYSIINRDRRLGQSAMEMESTVEDWMRVHRESEDKINMQRSVASRFYGHSTNDLSVSYDMEEVKESKEFRFAIQNSVHLMESSVRISNHIITELRRFLADLEEYETP
jgi:hypothetical protein